jgi:outer membrane protein TolC
MNALVLSAVLAATPITLDQVRQESRNNLQALLGELDRVRASEAKRQATGALLPQIQLQAQAGRTIQQNYRDIGTVVVLDKAGNPVLDANGQPTYRQAVTDFPNYAANRFILGATLNQVLFDLGKFQVLAQNGHLEAAARGTAAEQVLASEYEAVRRFYALWTAQKQLLVLQATAERSKEFADRAQALFEAGRGNKGDALSAVVNLGSDRINVEKQRAVVSQAQIDLASWLARPEGQELDAVDPPLPDTPKPPPVTLDQGLELARTNRPVLVQWDAQVKAAKAFETSQAAGWAPRVNFQLQWLRSGPEANTVFTDFGQQNSVTGTIALAWDIFNGFQTDAQTKQARAQLAQAKLNLEQNERDVEGQVKVALDSLGAQLKALEVAQQNRVTASQNLDYAQERFKAGASSTLEVRDAQLKLAQAYQTLIQTRSDAEVARAGLEKAMGTLGNGATP